MSGITGSRQHGMDPTGGSRAPESPEGKRPPAPPRNRSVAVIAKDRPPAKTSATPLGMAASAQRSETKGVQQKWSDLAFKTCMKHFAIQAKISGNQLPWLGSVNPPAARGTGPQIAQTRKEAAPKGEPCRYEEIDQKVIDGLKKMTTVDHASIRDVKVELSKRPPGTVEVSMKASNLEGKEVIIKLTFRVDLENVGDDYRKSPQTVLQTDIVNALDDLREAALQKMTHEALTPTGTTKVEKPKSDPFATRWGEDTEAPQKKRETTQFTYDDTFKEE